MNRRKLLVYAVLLAMAAVLITACGSSGSETPGAGTEAPGLGTSTGSETEVMTTTRVTTSTEVIEPTGAISPTEAISSTEVMTSTEALPPTGAVDPHRASVLMEFEVWNQNDEVIGVASDLVLDFDESKLTYVAVSPSSGDGTEVTLVPLDALEVVAGGEASADNPQNAFVLTVDAAVFEGAPTIDPAEIPGLGDDAMVDWDADIHSYWANALGMDDLDESMDATPTESTEATPAATEDSAMAGAALHGVSLASAFIGNDLETGDMQVVGTVDDVILDYESGDLQYAVILTGNGDLVPVPFAVISLDPETAALGLMAEPAVFDGAPFFESAEYPDTAESGWDQTYQDYWTEYLP